MKIQKNKLIQNRKLRWAIALLALLVTAPMPVLASGVTEIDSAGGVIIKVMVYIVRIAGAGATLWGAAELGGGIQSDDHTQKSKGIKRVLGGLIFIFSPELVSLIWPGFKALY